MTSMPLHPTPPAGTVAREQLRAVGLALRAEVLLVLGLLLAFLVMSIIIAIRAANDPHVNVGFMYGPAASIPTSILALLLPFGVWRSEEPSRRDYHWSMPVDHTRHTLGKVLYGWMWLMLLVAAYVAFLLALWANATLIAGEPIRLSVSLWEWFVPFTAATVGYVLTSALVVGSDHPWRWIMGIALGFLFVFAFLNAADLDAMSRVETSVLSGYYGLNAAVFGQVERFGGPSVQRWLGAAGLWLALGGAALYIVSSRRVHR
jgi:hypothetical protein